MKTHIENQLIDAGFERISTGGGCYAYCKPINGTRYVLVTDYGGIATNVTDDDYIVGMDDDGFPVADISRHDSISYVTNHTAEPVVDPSRDYATVSAALAAFGVQL
jgi:hypothetical protein